jgi:hypothetical protein
MVSAAFVLSRSNNGVFRSRGGKAVKWRCVEVTVVKAVENRRGFQLSTGDGGGSDFSNSVSQSSDSIEVAAVEHSEKSEERRESVDVDMFLYGVCYPRLQ